MERLETDPQRYRRAREVFDAVAGLAESERVAHLDRACGEDGELRLYVESMLRVAAHETGGTLPVLAGLTDLAIDADVTGSRLGKYHLIRRLGVGGMGTVYEAAQSKPRRTVALKLMGHAVASPDARRRFEYEIEILSRLRHPGIAHVYEAGTFEIREREVPFFAMELVANARSITEFAAARQMTVRHRVELFAKVCDAVQYGHQNGVVHRDLKPANILVDAAGEPKVIDFGVARSTNADLTLTSLHTCVGELLGTLAYMSPEQCDGDPEGIDTRSDVYSLGVVLYELLCGCLPYEVAHLSVLGAVRVVQEHAPRRPSEHHRALKGDLEAILLKALHKERTERYASVASLAADLRNFLAGLPIEARSPSRWARLVAWAARHPVRLTAAACIGIVTSSVLSILVFYWLYTQTPEEIVVDGSGRRAVLRSRASGQLREWDSGQDRGIVYARIHDRPDDFGGGRVAVVGFRDAYRPDESHGELHVYGLGPSGDPLWTTAVHELVQPPTEVERPRAPFQVWAVVVADILAGSPGDEVLVLHRKLEFSESAVRVFDFRGALRYEAWHFGALLTAVWLPDSRRAVLAGNERQYMWHERGVAVGDSLAKYPAVALALTPRDGHRAREWLVRDGKRQDATLAWYKWLGPLRCVPEMDDVVADVSDETGTYASTAHALVRIVARHSMDRREMSRLHFVVDSEGRPVHRFPDDYYKRRQAQGLLPAPEVFELLDYEDLPPSPPGRAGPDGSSPDPEERPSDDR